MEYLAAYGLSGLFVSAFLAATILPLSSEALLILLILNGKSPVSVVLVATLGNVAGSLVNYWLGRKGQDLILKRWMRMTDAEIAKASARIGRFGAPILLFAWVPVIGDPLTVAAGIFKIRLKPFLFYVSSGKFFRYVILAGVTLYF